MQPTTSPPTARPILPDTRRSTNTSSSRLVVGFVLALIGFILVRLPELLIFFFVFGRGVSIVEFSRITGTLTIVGYLLVGMGLFLLLRELGRRLSGPPAYVRFTPSVVLIGALFQAFIGLSFLWLLPALYGGFSTPPIPEEVFLTFQVGGWVADVAIGGAVLLAIAGAAFAPRIAPVVVAPPP